MELIERAEDLKAAALEEESSAVESDEAMKGSEGESKECTIWEIALSLLCCG